MAAPLSGAGIPNAASLSGAGIPRLESSRLILRGFTDGDLDAYAEISADPEVTRFLGGPVGRDDAWRGMAMHLGHWQLRGYGNWAIERQSDGVLLGRAGLWNPEGWPGLEVGWTLARHAWGQGYAREAASVAVNWAWETLDAPSLISVIDPRNARSISVAERLGMAFLREHLLRGTTPTVLYVIDRPAKR